MTSNRKNQLKLLDISELTFFLFICRTCTVRIATSPHLYFFKVLFSFRWSNRCEWNLINNAVCYYHDSMFLCFVIVLINVFCINDRPLHLKETTKLTVPSPLTLKYWGINSVESLQTCVNWESYENVSQFGMFIGSDL